MFDALDDYIGRCTSGVVIVSGGASGADRLAKLYATEGNIPYQEYPANWAKYGRRAGPIRNTLIADNVDVLFAFPSDDSRGTWDTVLKAKERGVEVHVITGKTRPKSCDSPNQLFHTM